MAFSRFFNPLIHQFMRRPVVRPTDSTTEGLLRRLQILTDVQWARLVAALRASILVLRRGPREGVLPTFSEPVRALHIRRLDRLAQHLRGLGVNGGAVRNPRSADSYMGVHYVGEDLQAIFRNACEPAFTNTIASFFSARLLSHFAFWEVVT